jgi:hypothetical protein
MSNKYYSPEGNLEVWDEKPEGYFTEEEWAELHPAPEPPEPTVDEKLAMLDADYNQQKADLLTAYQTAQMYGDTDTMESLKADLTALDNQYDEDYERIVGGE